MTSDECLEKFGHHCYHSDQVDPDCEARWDKARVTKCCRCGKQVKP